MAAIRIIDDHLELASIGSNTHAQIDTHIAAANNYIKRDGSLALTADWDIGNGRKILADEIRARDGDGLKLYEDGGKGIFIEDGGYVGFSTSNPSFPVEIDTGSLATAFRIKAPDGGGAYITSPFAGQVHFSGGTYYNGTNWIADLTNVGRIAITGSGISFFTDTALVAGNSYTPTCRFFIQPWSGKIGIATTSPTAKLDVNSDIFRLRTAKTPASAGAAGNQGDWCWDANYFYICVATNSWERTPHAWDINVYNDAAVTKLAGIETGATKYPDTGEQAFLDADHTKLNDIEAAADVTDSTNVTAAGAVMQSIIKVGAPSEVTLSDAGVATITSSHHTIDSYGDAATDTMTGIAGGVADQILILRPESSARTITIDSGFLNIALDGGADFVMDHANDQIMLLRLHDSDDWIEISRSNNGT